MYIGCIKYRRTNIDQNGNVWKISYLNLMYPSGTGSSFNILMDDCSLNFFSSGVNELSSSKRIDDIGLEEGLFSDDRLGSPGIRVSGCFVGSKTIPPGETVDVGNRLRSPGAPGIIGWNGL